MNYLETGDPKSGGSDPDGFLSPGLLAPAQATVQATYMTQYIRTQNQFTADVLPREDFYIEDGLERPDMDKMMSGKGSYRPGVSKKSLAKGATAHCSRDNVLLNKG